MWIVIKTRNLGIKRWNKLTRKSSTKSQRKKNKDFFIPKKKTEGKQKKRKTGQKKEKDLYYIEKYHTPSGRIYGIGGIYLS